METPQSPETEQSDRAAALRFLRRIVLATQHRAASALGVNEAARTEAVMAMLVNNSRRAPGYWIQLTLATGIATLGLVLGSTAVVIGAMLVSPLMGPILELGMGFAVGSSFLVLRASLRTALSVVVVVGGAALVTLALPFHEVTGEIASRTSPTALDLLVAVFCALTAAYTTVRPTSDTTSAAAGTAIGIALVPPLCVTGFGLGTGSLDVAGGASLLFIANLSAILVFAVLSFLLLGYNQVDAQAVERDFVEPDTTRTGRLAVRAQNALRNAFGSRYGFAMRVIIPALFLAAVYVPLRRALNEVTWEVSARDAIRRIIGSEARSAVQTSIVVERHTISLHLVLVGSNEIAAALEQRIRTDLAAATGVVPVVGVTAVPDAQTLATTAISHPPSTPEETGIDVATIHRRVASAIAAEWPSHVAGPLAGWELVISSHAPPAIVVRHIGPPVGKAGEALLASRWSAQAGAQVDVRDEPLADTTAVGRLGRERDWLAAAQPMLDWVAKTDSAVACVAAPIDKKRGATSAQQAALDSVRGSDAAQAGRLTLRDSSGWSIRVAIGRCAPPDSTH